MIRPQPISNAKLLEDEKFLLDLGESPLNLSMSICDEVVRVARRLLAAVKYEYEQVHRMTPGFEHPPSTEETLNLESKRRQIEEQIGAQICWMETIHSALVPIGWGDCVGILWEEDECLRRDDTAQRLPWALREFIGFHSIEELGQKLDSIDNGDSGLDLYAGGWVCLWSYNGDGLGRVYQVVQPPPDDGDEVSLEGMSSVDEWDFEGRHARKRGGGTP